MVDARDRRQDLFAGPADDFLSVGRQTQLRKAGKRGGVALRKARSFDDGVEESAQRPIRDRTRIDHSKTAGSGVSRIGEGRISRGDACRVDALEIPPVNDDFPA